MQAQSHTIYERGESVHYNFPVEVEPVFTRGNQEVPRARAVVRQDNGVPIANVSTRYKLVKHDEVMGATEKFIKSIGGKPTRDLTISSGGAQLLAEYTFKDRTLALEKGDVVGFRAYVENSYNTKRAIKIRVGALVLACMNGMIIPKGEFDVSIRHDTRNAIDWDTVFPKPEQLLSTFSNEVSKWNLFAGLSLTENSYTAFAEKALNDGIVTDRALTGVDRDKEYTAWALYNRFTYDITHQESGKASYINKVNRLARVARWMDNNFLSKT